jgi:hypothetical protein
MIDRFPIPKDTSFSSVEELRTKYKGKQRADTTEKANGTK